MMLILVDPRQQLRMRPYEEHDVRERSGRDERDRVGRRADEAREQLDGPFGHGPHGRFGQVRAVETGGAVNVGGDANRAHERAGRPGSHRDVGPAQQRQDAKGVPGRVLDARIAGHGGDPQDAQLGSREGQEDRQGVVMARVTVEDHGARSHPLSVPAGEALRARWSRTERVATLFFTLATVAKRRLLPGVRALGTMRQRSPPGRAG
jgi:hypothetical protein